MYLLLKKIDLYSIQWDSTPSSLRVITDEVSNWQKSEITCLHSRATDNK